MLTASGRVSTRPSYQKPMVTRLGHDNSMPNLERISAAQSSYPHLLELSRLFCLLTLCNIALTSTAQGIT